VPIIVKGRGILAGNECTALVNTADVFATVLEIAGAPVPPGTDSVSLKPYFSQPDLPSLRSWAYAENFRPNGFGPYLINNRAVRNDRFKLIEEQNKLHPVRIERLYDLLADPFEQTDLLDGSLDPEQAAAYAELQALLAGLHGPWTDLGSGLAGSVGVPELSPWGTLLPGDQIKLSLQHAIPESVALLMLGVQPLNLPFKGGLLVPDIAHPPGQLQTLWTDAQGRISLAGNLPQGLPTGLDLFMQFWIVDPHGAFGFSASNAVSLTVP
jgi:hypothetical protein